MKRFTTFLLMTLMSIIVWGQTQVPPKSSSPIYFKDGKVGIGTTAPDGPLHIKGGIAIQNPHIVYDSSGDAGEREQALFSGLIMQNIIPCFGSVLMRQKETD
jgi:hypothetical protein